MRLIFYLILAIMSVVLICVGTKYTLSGDNLVGISSSIIGGFIVGNLAAKAAKKK